MSYASDSACAKKPSATVLTIATARSPVPAPLTVSTRLPAFPNAKAGIENHHVTIDSECFDHEPFPLPAHFLAADNICQTFCNCACKNRSCIPHTPAQHLG